MKAGIELIAEERQEQIEKHGYTLEDDKSLNEFSQLSYAAHLLAEEYPHSLEPAPRGWSEALWRKMLCKTYPDRLVIAGALIAAELDRINNL